jgi:Fic family protein
LIENFKLDAERNPCLIAAELAHRFSLIHPFDDGNGRMSRLLLNWVLLKCGAPFPCTIGFGVIRRGARKRYFDELHADNKCETQSGRFLATLLVESTFEHNERIEEAVYEKI